MTIRLLCAYDKYPANAIVTLNAGTEAGLVATNQASTNLSGGTAFYVQVIPPAPVRALAGGGPISLKIGEQAKCTLPEGQALTVTGAASTTGTVARLDATGATLQTWAVGAGTLPPIGPFAGTQQLLITCTAGSIDATVGDAVLGAAPLPSNQPFSGYVAMIPGAQAVLSGSAKSIAGNPLAEAYPSSLVGRGNLTDAQMWANAGYMSTANIAGGQIEISLAAYAPNLKAGQGQLIAFVVNAAPPAASTGLISQGNGVNGVQGFSLTALLTSGRLSLAHVSQANGGVGQALGTSVATFCNSTDRFGMVYLHPSGYAVLWNPDAEIDSVFNVNTNVPLGITTPSAPLTLGVGATAGVNGGTAMAAMFKGFHLISFDTMPLNLNQIAKRLKADMMTPLRNSEVVLAAKVIGLYWGAAQSNELGSGNTPGVVGPYGVPEKDATSRSIKPALARLMAKRGVAALWGNSAIGSTAITDSWCGRIRNWVTNSNISKGSYMVYSGVLYKCTVANSSDANILSANSTVPPAVGTGADNITWASLGAPTAEDLAVLASHGVYGPTSARWDPNGHHAGAAARAAQMAPTVSEVVAIISLGQGDRYVGSSRAAYAAGIIYTTQYCLSGSANKVLIGMTCRAAVTSDYSAVNGGGVANADNDTVNHWYDRQLMPGRLDALAMLAGNPRVFPGHDWATGIGIVTSQTSPTGIGVKSVDGNVHLTDATYESLAVPLVDAALQAIGI